MLRRVYKLGNMTSDDLRSQLRKLMVLDDTGNWWMIGMESDSWYKYDGKAWLQATPPGHAPRAPLNPEPSATVTASMPFGTGTPTGAISGTPLPVSRPAPIRDLDATMVGKSTPYLDDTLRSQEPRRGVDATVPSAAVPGYQSYTDADRIASPSPTPSAQPAQQGQPDYGMRPSGLAENSNQLAGCAARAAILTLVLVLGGTMLAVLGAIGYYYSVINRFSPEIDALASNVAGQSQTLRIKDAEGRVIAEINDPNSGKRTLIKLDQISKYAIHATVSTEDSRFYENPGFDIIGIVRAVLQNVASGGTVSGASSITQQLARALVFDPNEVTGGNQTQRKIVEIFVASEISRRYNKNQILEMYLNQIPYGNYSNGIEAASQNYFGKPAKDLNLAESALIAGLPQAPSTYNPVVNKEAAFRRMDSVLNLMQEAGCIQMQHAPEDKAPVCITVADRNAAVVQIARVKTAQYSAPTVQITYPHFVTYVLADLERRYGANNIYKLGYDVTTTLNPTLQNAAEQAVKNQVALLRSKRVTNGSVLAINPSNGAILAMVGSADFFNKEIDGQFNVVFGARQPGSSIKPFIYAGTLERDPNTNKYLTPASIFWDVPTDFAGYRPTNYDNRFRGPVSMRASLANSYNIPAVRALEYLTLDRFQNLATRFGLDFPLTKPQQAGLALALGGVEVSLYDMVKGYAIFANQGKRVNSAYSIQRITKTTNGQEQVIFDVNRDEPPVASQVIDPGIAYLVTNIMADNQARCAAFGCPNILQLSDGRPAAVKTGTTNNFKDNWTIGYTPEVVVGVWVGNSNGDPMINVSGIDGAAPIWNQVMTSYLRGKPVSQFPVPQGVAQGQICADYGTAADFAECPAAMRRNEIFAATNPPVPSREVILVRKIDTFSGKIANDNCPNFQTTRVYLAGLDTWIINWLNNTNEGRVWADNHGLTRPVSPPPIADCQPGEPSPRVALEQPASGSSVSSLVAVYGQVDVTNFSRYQLMLSQANRPDVYVPLSGEIRAARPSPNSLLGTWDTNNVPDGNYFLALKFWDSQDRTAIVRIPVIVNNTNPAPAGGGIPTPTPPFGFSQSVTSVPVSFPTLTPIPPQQLVTPTIDPFAPGFPSVPTATQPLFPPTLTPPGR
jgi:penicillin-binding protein 1C